MDMVFDINQTAQISFEQTVNALHNSGIKPQDFHLELVGIEFLPGFDEFIAIGGEIRDEGPFLPPVPIAIQNLDNFLQQEIQNPTSNMFNLRENTNADLVILLGNVSGFIQNLSGIAVLGPNEVAPIAMVDAGKSTRNFLFAHELGHLFGCHHEECAAPWSTQNCIDENIQARHPHRWQNRKWLGLSKRDRYSIMYSDDSKNTRPYFSNPDVTTDGGRKTGTQWRNNAAWLRDMGCVISNWNENDTEPLFTYISGNNKDCPCAYVTLTSNIQGGAGGPFTYNWSYSYNGFTYSNYPFNTSSAYLRMPCPYSFPPQSGDGLYVRLEITDSEGNSHISWHFVEMILDNGSGSPCLHPHQRILEKSNQEEIEVFVFPVPTKDLLEIQISGYSKKTLNLDMAIINLNAQAIHSQSFKVKEGINKFSLDLRSYPAGLYYLRFTNSFTQEIITVKSVIKH